MSVVVGSTTGAADTGLEAESRVAMFVTFGSLVRAASSCLGADTGVAVVVVSGTASVDVTGLMYSTVVAGCPGWASGTWTMESPIGELRTLFGDMCDGIAGACFGVTGLRSVLDLVAVGAAAGPGCEGVVGACFGVAGLCSRLDLVAGAAVALPGGVFFFPTRVLGESSLAPASFFTGALELTLCL